jgi:protein O-mannosyl-transferase
LDYYPLRRLGWRHSILEKAPYFAVALAILIVAVQATQDAQDSGQVVLGTGEKLARACYAAVFYLGKSLWPAGLLPHYPVPRQGLALTAPHCLLSCLLVLAITVAAYMKRRAWPWLGACWLAYIAALAPVLGFVQHGTRIMAADRYAYLSSFPLVLLTGAAAIRISKWSWPAALRHGTFAALAVLMIGLTVQQMRIWRDTETLWRHVDELDGKNPFACNNLGNYLMDEQRYEEAAEVLARGWALDPAHLKLILNYGVSLEKLDRLVEAARVYGRALRYHPDHSLIHNNLGVVLRGLGDTQAAEQHFREALRFSPQLEVAQRNLQRLLDDEAAAGRTPATAVCDT